MGPFFSKLPNFSGFHHVNTPKFWKKWVYILRKIPSNGYLNYLSNWPLEMARVFETWVAHPCQNQTWVPPYRASFSSLERGGSGREPWGCISMLPLMLVQQGICTQTSRKCSEDRQIIVVSEEFGTESLFGQESLFWPTCNTIATTVILWAILTVMCVGKLGEGRKLL